MSSYFIC